MAQAAIREPTQYLTFSLDQEVFALEIAKVREVIDLDPAQVEPPPRIGMRLDTAFIRGMGKRDGEFLIVLDIDRVFSADELGGATARSSEIPAGDPGPA